MDAEYAYVGPAVIREAKYHCGMEHCRRVTGAVGAGYYLFRITLLNPPWQGYRCSVSVMNDLAGTALLTDCGFSIEAQAQLTIGNDEPFRGQFISVTLFDRGDKFCVLELIRDKPTACMWFSPLV